MQVELDLKEAKNLIDKTIKTLSDNLKSGVKIENPPESLMQIDDAVKTLADKGDKDCEELLSYHNQMLEKFLLDCNKELIAETNNNFIDEFLICIEKINTMIYWMNHIFSYLEKIHLIPKVQKTLSEIEMNIYKKIFYEKIKKDIYKELEKIINEERNGNKELRPKIKKILNILKWFEFDKPKIIKDKNTNQIQWIDEGNSDFPKESSELNLWFKEYLIEDEKKFD